MILFLYGEDSFRSRQKLDEIIAHYKASKKSGLSLAVIDASQTDFKDFYDQFKIAPMFAETKLVIVKNAFAGKKFQEDLLIETKKIEELKDVVVIYEAEAPDQRLKLFKVLTKECKSQQFEFLDARKLRMWISGQFERANQKANADAVDVLAQSVGNDLWRMHNEIQKLIDYKQGQPIRKEDVVLQVRAKIETDIFKTIDVLAQKNKAAALQLLHKHLENGDNALYLFSMVAYQFKNLLIVKELAEQGLMYNSIVKKSGLHPFVVKKTYYMCSQFTFADLKRIYWKIYETDVQIKTGKIEPELSLDRLVALL